MQRIAMVGILAALFGCAAPAPADGSGDQCSCPPGPPGPQGPQGPQGEPGPPGQPGEGGEGGPWQSGSRLTLLTITSEDGASMPWGGFWDEELQVACGARDLEGQLRCVPYDLPWEDHFDIEELARFSR